MLAAKLVSKEFYECGTCYIETEEFLLKQSKQGKNVINPGVLHIVTREATQEKSAELASDGDVSVFPGS